MFAGSFGKRLCIDTDQSRLPWRVTQHGVALTRKRACHFPVQLLPVRLEVVVLLQVRSLLALGAFALPQTLPRVCWFPLSVGGRVARVSIWPQPPLKPANVVAHLRRQDSTILHLAYPAVYEYPPIGCLSQGLHSQPNERRRIHGNMQSMANLIPSLS